MRRTAPVCKLVLIGGRKLRSLCEVYEGVWPYPSKAPIYLVPTLTGSLLLVDSAAKIVQPLPLSFVGYHVALAVRLTRK